MKRKYDLSYRRLDDIFTVFYPNTLEGENAWRKIAGKTDGTGKIYTYLLKSALRQLSEAGYTVSEIKTKIKD